jgi:phage repressor protein C with HTH and peptisase S24 domain
MYESGEVTPDVDKLKSIAKVLHCSPEWLAFGVGARSPIEEVSYDSEAGDFVSKRFQDLDEDWLRTQCDVEPTDAVLCVVNDFSPHLKPGDVAIVKRGVKPNAGGGEYVFARDDELTVAHVTRPHSAGTFRVYAPDLKSHEDIDDGELNFLGKVVGKQGSL